MGFASFSSRWFRAWSVCAAVIGCPALCLAQPDYGIDFVTVSAPGNAPASPSEFQYLDFNGIGPVGAVNYEYRLARTELTVAQWHEFVVAYAPYHQGFPADFDFTGSWISPTSLDPANPDYRFSPAAANFPAETSWYYAARYCNWLQNGKIATREAFEQGVYDTSLFTHDNSTWNMNIPRSPAARYWIPSLDEWTKGMHYDPNKNGPGSAGYWLYPHSKDVPPVGGFPGTPGAETAAGEYPDHTMYPLAEFDVGSYPNARSPWGLLDGSGGQDEWMDMLGRPGPFVRGTNSYDLFPFLDDRLDYAFIGTPWVGGRGLRLASAVPSPTSVTMVGMITMLHGFSRRRFR